ncbi:MAG: non-ribosomal peptide synthetase [Candidatus Sulfotelmatobacter sp.]
MGEHSVKSGDFSDQKLALLASLLGEEGLPQAPALKRIPRVGEPPLSSAQMRLWLFDQLEPGSAAYNIPVRHEFKGHFDIGAFERSLSEIVRRHEVLRTYYLRIDGRPVQKIAPPELFRIPVVDLQGLPATAREQEVARLSSVDARQPFDLGSAPLMRARLLELAPDEHVLLLNFHHIAFDWWSLGVFEGELAVLYDAFLGGGEASPLPDLPLQYVDFDAWLRQSLQGKILQEQLDYWQRKLKGTPPVLELPTDHPRPAVQTYNGSFLCSELSKKLTEALKILSQREGVTLFATLLGAFKVLLQRYTGQDDILVGAPIAGRNQAEVEGLIGFFVNTLVMRADLSGDPTFRQLLRRVQETTLGAFAHQDLPFDKLVEVLNPERDSSRSPMFQVMLSMLNTPVRPLYLSGLQNRRTMMDSGTSKFDLTLYAMEEPQGLSFACEYNTDLFHSDRIERMLGHLQVLLEGIVGNPDQRLSELPLLTMEERQQLLIGWNDTRVAYPQDVSLHELFEAQVQRTPEAVAVEYDGKQLTYCELNQKANQLAHYLRTLGVGPDTLVGVCMERSLELVVALYGILKAGGAYVPIDPEYPQERIGYMLEDAGLSVLLTQRRIIGRLPSRGAKTLCLDDGWEQIASENSVNPAKITTSGNLAYMIYTSGSTGKPKGAMNSHRGICNRLLWMQSQYGLTEADRILQKTPASFDVSVWEFFWPLLTGARLVLAKPGGHQDAAYLVRLITEQRITVTHFVPSMLAIFLAEPGAERCASLRHVICSGEALPFNLQEQFFKLLGAQLHNLYGPTEAAVDVTHWTCRRDDRRNMVPIGRPVANTQIYILDRYLQPVPIGVSGDLFIGGVQVGRGYHNRADLTAEKFIPDPFSADPAARVYKTGDLCRWLSDGNIEYLGRSDFQVKVRGLRIELGEIEAILGRHEAVRQCVVVAREETPGDKVLVAYVERQPTGPVPTVSDLRSYLTEYVPAYMIPSVFVVLEKLPLSPNGKIDRKALPRPDQGRMEVAGEFVAPRDSLEQMLAQIWSEILSARRIGIHDNFFELGGHSLLAVRIMAEIERLVKRRLPLATFLQAPTIAHLADVLRKEDWKPSWSSLTPIRAGGAKPPLFLMHSHGGNVLEYYPLAKYLDADQPVYALQARGLDGHIRKDQSFEEMAEAHLAELRSLQPEGPYFLGGYCLGGLLALEAAHQLSIVGEEVALVVLIQSINPTYARFRPDLTIFQRGWYRTTKRIDLELEYLRHRGANHILERCRRTWDIALARTAITLDNRTGNGHSQRKPRSMAYTLEMLAIEHDRARVRYVPRPYNGPVCLFRASKQLSGLMTDSTLGWKDVLNGDLKIFEVPGHQETMLSEPNVLCLAEKLTAQLHAVQQSPVSAKLVVDSANSAGERSASSRI